MTAEHGAVNRYASGTPRFIYTLVLTCMQSRWPSVLLLHPHLIGVNSSCSFGRGGPHHR